MLFIQTLKALRLLHQLHIFIRFLILRKRFITFPVYTPKLSLGLTVNVLNFYKYIVTKTVEHSLVQAIHEKEIFGGKLLHVKPTRFYFNERKSF